MKIYISGAITDNPHFKEQFSAAEQRLKAQGHDVINPARNQGYTYKEYIDTGLFELMHCEAIYLLKGYDQSTGATLEHDYARTVGLEIMREEDEVDGLAAWAGDDVVTGLIRTADKKIRQLVKKAAETPERNMVAFNPIVIKPEMADIYKMVNEFIVKRQKELESKLLGEITEIAIENGIRTEVVLNEKAIAQALMKSQKRKVYFDREFYLNCPQCNGCGVEKFKGYKPKYCPDCGQALDWEV